MMTRDSDAELLSKCLSFLQRTTYLFRGPVLKTTYLLLGTLSYIFLNGNFLCLMLPT
jgi:hypothetical protein